MCPPDHRGVLDGPDLTDGNAFPCFCQVSLDFVTPWTVAHQAPLSMGFSRQEPWSGLPCPSPGDLPDPGIKPRSPAFQANYYPSEPSGKLKDKGIRPFFFSFKWSLFLFTQILYYLVGSRGEGLVILLCLFFTFLSSPLVLQSQTGGLRWKMRLD